MNKEPTKAAWPSKIVSGGQTGVDRAALDVAISMSISHGGWCPRGRRAEDGAIDPMYSLHETPESDYRFRTERNVLDSDATLVLYRDQTTGGTELTVRLAKKHGKPLWIVDLNRPAFITMARDWLVAEEVHVLNVAGPRESTAPGIGKEAQRYLRELLGLALG